MSSMPFVIDDPCDIKDGKRLIAVPNDLMGLVNDIFDGAIVASKPENWSILFAVFVVDTFFCMCLLVPIYHLIIHNSIYHHHFYKVTSA